jgi:serine/threonine protein kinase KIN1/2
LSPPPTGDGFGRKLRGLGRSTSVNSAEMRRRISRRTATEGSSTHQDVPPTSGSDGSSVAVNSATSKQNGEASAAEDATGSQSQVNNTASRRTSLGHARRESIQTRRLQRHSSKRENRDATQTEGEDTPDRRRTTQRYSEKDDGAVSGAESMKPVYLKGLFSVSTTSSRPLPEIRAEIIRVLRQLGVDFTEVKGGFSCIHAPSIDLRDKERGGLASPRSPDSQHAGQNSATLSHRRKISFGMGAFNNNKDRDDFRDDFRADNMRSPATPATPATPSSHRRHRRGDSNHNARTDQTAAGNSAAYSNTNTDDSDASDTAVPSESHNNQSVPPTPSQFGAPRPRPAGETSTQVQNDVSNSMVLRFDIFIVKVPLLSLHGIQFKKVEGNIMGYKNMAQEILKGLRL